MAIWYGIARERDCIPIKWHKKERPLLERSKKKDATMFAVVSRI